MGSDITMSQNPKFVVKAAGSFKQKEGCPSESIESLSAGRLEYLCAGECYNPSSERQAIERIEIVKITPQLYAGEAINPLINDAWKVFSCEGKSECVVEFEDESYSRDSVYYARVIQEATLAINGSPQSDSGFKLCKGSYKTDLDDNCLSLASERAWSSPIYLSKP